MSPVDHSNALTKAVVLLLFANLLLAVAVAFTNKSAEPTSSAAASRYLRSLTSAITEPNRYYSGFTNYGSQRTLYRETIYNKIGTVGAIHNPSRPHSPFLEWTKQPIDCPKPLHRSIPEHYSECFVLIHVASGTRLYNTEDSTTNGVGTVAATSPMNDNQIWLHEYPLAVQQQVEDGWPDLVTIRNVASGRRLFATNDEEEDLSVGFGASNTASLTGGGSSSIPSDNELWEERIQYKYANVIAQ